jgi:hypothetical protein
MSGRQRVVDWSGEGVWGIPWADMETLVCVLIRGCWGFSGGNLQGQGEDTHKERASDPIQPRRTLAIDI